MMALPIVARRTPSLDLALQRSKISRVAITVISLLTVGGGARAQAPAGPVTDPLAALVREAIRNNRGITQERLADRRSEAAVRQARGLFLPSLGVDARYSRFDGVINIGDFVNPAYAALNDLIGEDRFPTDIDAPQPFRQQTALRLTQPLFNGGIRANYAAARGLRGLQGAQLRAATRQLSADVQLAYIGYASAERLTEVYRGTLDVVRENERVSDRLLAAGRVTAEAVLRARAERSDVEQQLADVERRRDSARRGLNLLLGRDSLDAAVPILSDSAIVPETPDDGEALVRQALARREEIEQASMGVRIAEAQASAARASFLPSVALALDYGVQGQQYRWSSSSDYVVASLVLQWNLFSGGQDASRQQQAQLDIARHRVRQDEVAQQVALQVRDALQGVRVAAAAIRTSEERLTAAERSFRLVTRRYENGLASQIEFLDARTAYTNAGLNRVLTRYAHAARYVELERVAALRSIDR